MPFFGFQLMAMTAKNSKVTSGALAFHHASYTCGSSPMTSTRLKWYPWGCPLAKWPTCSCWKGRTRYLQEWTMLLCLRPAPVPHATAYCITLPFLPRPSLKWTQKKLHRQWSPTTPLSHQSSGTTPYSCSTQTTRSSRQTIHPIKWWDR